MEEMWKMHLLLFSVYKIHLFSCLFAYLLMQIVNINAIKTRLIGAIYIPAITTQHIF